jgi:hypothetical protein
MLSARERPLPISPPSGRPPLLSHELDEIDVLQAWRNRDVNDLDVDEPDDLELLARLRDEADRRRAALGARARRPRPAAREMDRRADRDRAAAAVRRQDRLADQSRISGRRPLRAP